MGVEHRKVLTYRSNNFRSVRSSVRELNFGVHSFVLRLIVLFGRYTSGLKTLLIHHLRKLAPVPESVPSGETARVIGTRLALCVQELAGHFEVDIERPSPH